MPRGKSRSSNRGKTRAFSSPDEIDKDLEDLAIGDHESSSSLSPEEDDYQSITAAAAAAAAPKTLSTSSSDSEDEKIQKPKGVSNLISIENPNRISKFTPNADGSQPDGEAPQLSRREREQLQKAKSRENYQKLMDAGKTDEAKADLARLAIIKKQRQEAQARRVLENQQKEQELKSKREQTARALGKK